MILASGSDEGWSVASVALRSEGRSAAALQGDRKRHPVHLYRLRHIVVVKNQVFSRQPVHVVSFGIGDCGRRDYQRDAAFELRRSHTCEPHEGNDCAHRGMRGIFWAEGPGHFLNRVVEIVMDRVKSQFQTVRNPQLVEDIVQMVLHRLFADEHALGHFAVFETLCHQDDDFTLPRA